MQNCYQVSWKFNWCHPKILQAIHGNAAVCQFTIDISSDSPFTGLFKAGETISGLIRMGSASDFPGLVPGIGVKMLRTGKISANLVALHKLDALPNGNHNFFAVPLSNAIPGKAESLATRIVGKRFCQATGTGTLFNCRRSQGSSRNHFYYWGRLISIFFLFLRVP